jgi:hypothetical protein
MNKLRNLVTRPFFRRALWLAFAVLFFYSGLYFTEWLLEPEIFAGGPLRWALVVLFPLLVPLFFVVNRRFGCASGSCAVAANPDHRTDKRGTGVKIMRMPGA